MKKVISLLVLVAFFSATHSAVTTELKPPLKASEIYLPVGNAGQTISLMDLSQISVKEFENVSGKKMNFIDRISFKIGQRSLRNSINKDGTFNKKKVEKLINKADAGGGFHAGGFFLGLILGLIGVLIAYLIKDDKKKARVKWAWIGWAIWLVILLITVAA